MRVQNSSAYFVDTTAKGNRAGQYDGCIFVRFSNVTLSETNASNNSGGSTRGFVSMQRSTAKLAVGNRCNDALHTNRLSARTTT